MQWRPFIKSIAESLSLKTDLLPKSQIYFAYTGRTVLSVTDQSPIEVKEHLLVASSTEPRKEPQKLSSAQSRALLSDELETFSYAYNAVPGERYRSLVRLVYHAHDLGADIDYTSDLVEAVVVVLLVVVADVISVPSSSLEDEDRTGDDPTGESEASAFEWGCRAAGRAKDDLIDALVDAINDQGHIHDVTFSEVSEWFDEIKEQQ
jgi:hypothetical protein